MAVPTLAARKAALEAGGAIRAVRCPACGDRRVAAAELIVAFTRMHGLAADGLPRFDEEGATHPDWDDPAGLGRTLRDDGGRPLLCRQVCPYQ